MTSHEYNSIVAKVKLNNFAQEINQTVHKIMTHDLESMGPDKFIETGYDFDFEKSGVLGDNNLNFSRNPRATGLETYGFSKAQYLPYEGSYLEDFNSSQGSDGSPPTSTSRPIQGYSASIPPMTNTSRIPSSGSEAASAITSVACLPVAHRAVPLKRSYSETMGKPSEMKRGLGEFDPENHEIVRLRQEEGLDFQDIANKLNIVRSKNGNGERITMNAVYSRYKRNGPAIIEAKGQGFKPTQKDAAIKFKMSAPITGFSASEDELLKTAARQIQDEYWTMVSKRVEELGGTYHEPNMCERRYRWI